MKSYELTYLISSEISEEEARQLQTKITSLVQEQGGIFVQEKILSKKRLAYSVKKQTQVFLANIIFQTLPEKLINLEKLLKEEKQILRYLILIKLPPKKMKAIRPFKKPILEKKVKVELKEIEKKLDEILEQT